jgi:hypothetical protein
MTPEKFAHSADSIYPSSLKCTNSTHLPLRVDANSHSGVILYKFLTNSNHLLYLETPLLEVLALNPPTEEATPMRNASLLAHELLCLHLKSFYGLEPCSPSPEARTVRALTRKVGRRFRGTGSLRRGTPRF